ncbi:sushi, nidogen and EGF-like domain-containing protein 1 [Anneissia japonica]|uniref:sushi, nidogen and EGF-like domain-containing protein 1 n=1 Tax=Anneissia japonica TaxID=1529436 RepID=UPI0014256C47|nr:sushi, nidogen and EGF-like domain-containing protein 1 [Anneissia japonica]
MTTSLPLTDLRWTHNYGDIISKWNGSSSIKIEDVREQDGGVYECFPDESMNVENQGIMRLIVRACPSPKWNPPSCEYDCPVCYNGGVCDDKTGLCVCPTGFKGVNCETGCGSGHFGRYCNLVCSSTGTDESCRNNLFCPPDPVGCSCVDGYEGLGCSQPCGAGWYGSSCQQKCHCDNTYCDRKYGCTSSSDCWDGYTGPQCQVLSSDKSCPSGYFGELCNYSCHCSAGADCNRDDGSCTNGCSDSWAGSNCSIALPYLSRPPIATPKASTILVDVTWTQGKDYGTGTITSWTLWYKKEGSSQFTSINSNTPDVIKITGLKLHETVTYYSILSRSVEGVNTPGPGSPQEKIQTTCSEPAMPSPPISTFISQTFVEVQWMLADGLKEIQCSDVLLYQVGHRNTMMSSRSIANTTHNTEKMMRISGLSECTEYAVDLRVLNDKEFKSPWSEAINITTLPSVPIFVSTNSTILETSFTMKWHTLASCNSGTDLLYHYRLNYVKSNDEYRSGNTSDTEVEITISDDVEPCTEFSFHVSVSFMEVIGQASSIKLSTDAELPGVPEMISAEYSGGSINVEWHPPVNLSLIHI